jgi:hypothetical protein
MLKDIATRITGNVALAVVNDTEKADNAAVRAEFRHAQSRVAEILEKEDLLRDEIENGYKDPSKPIDGLVAKREELRRLADERRLFEVRVSELADRVEQIRLEELRAVIDAEMEVFRPIEARIRELGDEMWAGVMAAVAAWRKYEQEFAEYRAWDQRMKGVLGRDRNRAPTLTAASATHVYADVLQLINKLNTAVLYHEKRESAPMPPAAPRRMTLGMFNRLYAEGRAVLVDETQGTRVEPGNAVRVRGR